MGFDFQKFFTKPYKRKFIISLITACVLTIANYFVNNAPLFTFESITQYYWFQKFCKWAHLKSPVDYGDAVYFNISYDKQFVPAYEGDYADDIEGASLLGNNIITDRKKLYKFLSLLKKTNSYKYVIIDVAFDDVRDKTEYDDSLFNTIKSMRDIVFADIDLVKLSRTDLYNKRAKAFYYYTPTETNFARYQYTVNDTASLASYVFNDIYPTKKIKEHGFAPLNFYSSDGKLCYNSLFLTFDENSMYSDNQAETIEESTFEQAAVFNLGQFLNEFRDDLPEEIDATCSDKFVVICNTETDDLHDNYVGIQFPGAQIIMRALTSLCQGRHLVSFWNTIYWFAIFFVLGYFAITNRPPKIQRLICKIPLLRRMRIKFWNFILSLISYSVILVIFSFLEYIWWDRVTSIVLPLIVFSTINLYHRFKQTSE